MKLKTMVVVIAAFFGASMLALHLIYRSEPTAPEAPAAGATPLVPAQPPAPPQEERLAPGADPGLTGTALASASPDRERELNDCIERNVHGAGYDDVKQVLPGRWPAVKRARERLRMRRLEVRAACEQELAR